MFKCKKCVIHEENFESLKKVAKNFENQIKILTLENARLKSQNIWLQIQIEAKGRKVSDVS